MEVLATPTEKSSHKSPILTVLKIYNFRPNIEESAINVHNNLFSIFEKLLYYIKIILKVVLGFEPIYMISLTSK